MKHALFVFFFAVASTLGAATFELKNASMTAKVDTRGGSLDSIAFGGKMMTIPQMKSFTDRILYSVGKKQMVENFAPFVFDVREARPDQVVFSTRGRGACADLRLVKTYEMDRSKPILHITYTVTNLGKKAQGAGFWSKGFFAPDYVRQSMQMVHQSRRDAVKVLRQPDGKTNADEFAVDPAYAVLAVENSESRQAVVLRFPPSLTDGFYSWFSKRDGLFTSEWFLREVELAPGASKSFTIELECVAKLPSLTVPAQKIGLRQGRSNPYVALLGANDKSVKVEEPGAVAATGKYVDLSVAKQYLPSIRAVRFGKEVKLDRVAVYELENGHSDTSRPVPFAIKNLPSGEKQLLFSVPGTNFEGYYYTGFIDGRAQDMRRSNKDLGSADFRCRVELESVSAARQDDSLQKAAPGLVYNGSFEKQAPYGEWADGYYWSFMAQKRNTVAWLGGDAAEGKRYMQVSYVKGYPMLPVYFRIEPRTRYRAGATIRSVNPAKNWAIATVNFIDGAGKELRNHTVRLRVDRDSYGWTKVEKEFHAPEGAVAAYLRFATGGREQTLDVDQVFVEPADIPFTPKAEIDVLRDELKSGFYKPLDLLEKISHETVTPHEKFFKNAAFQLPELLYLSSITHTNEDMTRRLIVELAQRMDLRYRYIPLLRKITNMRGSAYGVHYPVVYAPVLEKYTIESIRNVKNVPKIVIVQQIDFKTQTQPEFAGILEAMRNKGANFLFVDCEKIPSALLGEKIKLPADIALMPVMRPVSGEAVTLYRQGNSYSATCDFSGDLGYYLKLGRYACVPREMLGQQFPDYNGREFPYWEYMYLPMLKTLRFLGGAPGPRVVAAADSVLTVESRAAGNYTLRTEFRDDARHVEGVAEQSVAVKDGQQSVALKLPNLPGGIHIAHYQLLDGAGRVVDAGAFRFDTPQNVRIDAIDFADAKRIFAGNQPVAFTVKSSGFAPGSKLICSLEDIRHRIVGRVEKATGSAVPFEVALHAPYSPLYRLRVELRDASGNLKARANSECSVPQSPDLTDMRGLMWLGRKESGGVLRDLGFDLVITQFRSRGNRSGVFRNMANFGLGAVTMSSGDAYKNFHDYRGDMLDGKTVRTPCFSDPVEGGRVHDALLETAKGSQFDYFNVRNHMLSDESFLGARVCYSPHCLSGFRAELKKAYGSIDRLNKSWGASFKSFDEVVPKQLAELASADNLAPWLDHKVFMSKVFARNYVGRCAAALKEVLPDTRVGLSGTQNPGYSYDWSAMMKHLDFLSYYDGIQIKMIHDFAGKGFVNGQWGGGYTQAHLPFEPYNQATTWGNLLRGANLSAHWHGAALNGDLAPTENLRFFADALSEAKRGIAKTVLSADQVEPQAVMLYNHASCMAAIGTVGAGEFTNSLTGWKALLDDMKIPFRFITSDALRGLKAKLLILPCTLVLSDRDVAEITCYVKNGGCVIADFAPGYYDGHGTKRLRAEVTALFGTMPGKLELRNRPVGGLSLRMLPDAENALEQVRALGKGKVMTLNFSLSNYYQVALGGVGGEESVAKSGPEVFRRHVLAQVGAFCRASGVQSALEVADAAGKPYSCMTVLRRDNRNLVVGIYRETDANPARYRDMKGDRIRVTLPQAGFVYDVRNGSFVTHGRTFDAVIRPGSALIYSVLPEKGQSILLTVPSEVRAGSVCTLKIAEQSGPRVYHISLRDPAGREVACYRRNVRFASGSGEVAFQMAYNDTPGRWTVTVRAIQTGEKKSVSFLLRQ